MLRVLMDHDRKRTSTERAGERGTVLFVGASGRLGRATVPLLSRAGWFVRAMSRHSGKLDDLAGERVVPVRGDLRDRSTLAAACSGADAVVAAAHAALGNWGSNRPVRVDREGNRALVETAKSAGVKRFVFVSASAAAVDHPLDFFRIKAEAEGFVRDAGVPFVILKPGAFMETWAEIAGAPILDKGRAVLIGDTTRKVNYVSVRDVARFVEIALRDDTLLGETLRLGGPENLTVDEVVAAFERAAGRTARRIRIPRAIVTLARVVSRPLVPGMHRMLSMATLRPSEDDVFDPTPLLARYPIDLTRIEDVARERAKAMRGRGD